MGQRSSVLTFLATAAVASLILGGCFIDGLEQEEELAEEQSALISSTTTTDDNLDKAGVIFIPN